MNWVEALCRQRSLMHLFVMSTGRLLQFSWCWRVRCGTDSQGADHSHSNIFLRAGTDPCTNSGSALFRCSDARRSSQTHWTGPSRFLCCCFIHLELSTCWDSTVWKHSHFQTPLENPSMQTHLVLLCCIKRLCIFGPKGVIPIRYYYYYYFFFLFDIWHYFYFLFCAGAKCCHVCH